MQCGGGGGDFRSICTMVSQRQHLHLTATSSALLCSDNYTVRSQSVREEITAIS